MSMYLQLLHGRNRPDELLNDWGFDGPCLGPIDWVHFTYGDISNIGVGGEAIECFFGESNPIQQGLFCYNGCYYGDWEFAPLDTAELRDRKPVPFDEKLAVWGGTPRNETKGTELHEDEGG